ncbi:ABC transporter substrate-binding protein [Candidatus Woesearchaeota archaeon]|nr:ABC transporter substrate-binding protein [Candidatus Woesearchaeota archaeon]
MKPKIIFPAIVLLSLILFGCSSTPTQEKNVLNIGMLLPLTTNVAAYGQDAQEGVMLALDEKPQDLTINLFIEDHQADPKVALSAYEKITIRTDLAAVITAMSPVSLALQPVLNQDHNLQMAVFSSTPDYTSLSDYSFRTTARAELENKAIVDYVISKYHYKSAAILYLNNDMGLGHRKGFTDAFVASEGKIVLEEAFDAKEQDLRGVLTKIKIASPDVLYIAADAKNVGRILKQAEELSFSIPIVSTRAVEHPDLVSIAGAGAEEMLYPYPFDVASPNPVVQEFVTKYKAKYGKDPSTYSAEGYIAMKLLLEAFEDCNANEECARTHLNLVHNSDSIFGPISFDAAGDVSYPFMIKKVENGQFVVVKE